MNNKPLNGEPLGGYMDKFTQFVSDATDKFFDFWDKLTPVQQAYIVGGALGGGAVLVIWLLS